MSGQADALRFITQVTIDDQKTKLAFRCPRGMTQEEVKRAIQWVHQNHPDYIRKGLSTEIQLPDGFFS